MTTPASSAALRRFSFFEGFSDADLDALAAAMDSASFDGDIFIFHEGDPRRMFAVIEHGSVAIEKGHDGRPMRLATLGAGEVLGEGVLVEAEEPHGTSARTLEPTTILYWNLLDISVLLQERPGLFAGLVARSARFISRRLRAADATLAGHRRLVGFAGGRRRMEHDLLGEHPVPEDALYGIQTLRALENFPITGTPIREFPAFIAALAAVKEAAALANGELGLLDPAVRDAIVRAAREIRAGRHHEHFLVDVIQGGAGTSTNMNANEVIANRALELLGRQRGEYDVVHPNNHVNLSQSTNDVYPTAVKLALHASIDQLKVAMHELAGAFLEKGHEFAGILKMGRTQLQDAVPMTLGQEFAAFGHTMLEDIDRLGETQALIREINMGATAIGTGITAPPGYAERVRHHLSEVTGLPLITAPDLVEATADTGVFVQLSGVLKRCAVKLSKICNDLRLLSSGPRAGLGEINLPPRQPGSSIMPGKVNPVIPEVVNQVCFDVIGGDVTVTIAAEGGQLQLNVFEPVIAYRLLGGLQAMRNACVVLRERCVAGITANPDRMRWFVEHSIGIVTALLPAIGYEAATRVARAALESNRSVYDVVLEQKLLTRERLDEILDPRNMVQA